MDTPDTRSLEELSVALKSNDVQVRIQAAFTFSMRKLDSADSSIIDTLVLALSDSDLQVQLFSSVALSGAKEIAVGPLLNALSNPNSSTRIKAAESLSRISSLSIAALNALIQTALYDPDSKVRDKVSFTLGSSNFNKDLIKPVIQALSNTNVEVSNQAAKILIYIGGEAVESLVLTLTTAVEPELRITIINSLELIGHIRAIEPIKSIMIHDQDASVKFKAACALATFGSNDGIEILRSYIDHSDINIGMQANIALFRLGHNFENIS